MQKEHLDFIEKRFKNFERYTMMSEKKYFKNHFKKNCNDSCLYGFVFNTIHINNVAV